LKGPKLQDVSYVISVLFTWVLCWSSYCQTGS